MRASRDSLGDEVGLDGVGPGGAQLQVVASIAHVVGVSL